MRSAAYATRMRQLVTVALLALAVIHLLPVIGVTSRLRALYGLGEIDAQVELLLRHRAVLFGLLGAYCAWAAFDLQQQLAALIAGLISTLAFLLLAHGVPMTSQLARVQRVDQLAVALAVIGLVVKLRS
ncbi:MAG: phosphopantetheine adenylyltransferase [Archangium sp.]